MAVDKLLPAGTHRQLLMHQPSTPYTRIQDMFRGFFLFSLIIAYISLCRIVTSQCTFAITALKASARNARTQNNEGGADRMELKALFFRALMTMLLATALAVCVMLIITAFVRRALPSLYFCNILSRYPTSNTQ